jgi:hypothetical protein
LQLLPCPFYLGKLARRAKDVAMGETGQVQLRPKLDNLVVRREAIPFRDRDDRLSISVLFGGTFALRLRFLLFLLPVVFLVWVEDVLDGALQFPQEMPSEVPR